MIPVFAPLMMRRKAFGGGYIFRSSQYDVVAGSPSTSNYTVNIGAAAADRLVIVAVAAFPGAGGSVTVTVAGIPLTQQVFVDDSSYGAMIGIFSGVVASGVGNQTVAVAWTGASFADRGMTLWTATGLTNTEPKSMQGDVSGGASDSLSLSVSAGDFLFGYHVSTATRNFDTSTIIPTREDDGGAGGSGGHQTSADWLIGSANSAFSVTAGASNGPTVEVSYGSFSSPLDLPGLLAWYSADSGVYSDAGVTLATNTQTVQQWNDRSGNGYHLLQATAGTRPQYLSGGFNSKQTVQFTAATPTGMLTAPASVVVPATAPSSGFFVGQMLTGTHSVGRAFDYSGQFGNDSDVNGCIWAQRNSGGNSIVAYRNGTTVGSQAISLATNLRFGVVFDGTNGTTYLNNANATATGDTDVFGNSPGALGVGINVVNNQVIGANGWDGPISEIVITKSALNSGHRTLLDAYFRTKWGL